MKIFHKSIMALAAAGLLLLTLNACSDDKTGDGAGTTISPELESLVVDGAGTVKQRIEVLTDLNGWNATCEADWVTVSAHEDHIIVTVEPNLAKTTRESIIVIGNNVKTVDLPVMQDRRRALLVNTYDQLQWSIVTMSKFGRYLYTSDGTIYDWDDKITYECPITVAEISEDGICYGNFNSQAAYWEIGTPASEVVIITPDVYSFCSDVTPDGAVLGSDQTGPGLYDTWIYEHGRKEVLPQPEESDAGLLYYARKISDDQSVILSDADLATIWLNKQIWRPSFNGVDLYRWVNMPGKIFESEEIVDWWNWQSCLKEGSISRNGRYIGSQYYETGYDPEIYEKVDTYTVPVLIDLQANTMKRFDDFIGEERDNNYNVTHVRNDGSIFISGAFGGETTYYDAATGKLTPLLEWLNDEYGVTIEEKTSFVAQMTDDGSRLMVYVTINEMAYKTYFIVREY